MRMIPAEVLGCRCGPRYQGGKNKRLLEWEKKGTQKEQRKKARNQRRQRKTLERAFFCRPSSPSPSFALPRPLLLFSLALPLSFSFSLSLSLSILSLSPQLRYAFLGDLLGLGGVERLRPGGSTSLGPATK